MRTEGSGILTRGEQGIALYSPHESLPSLHERVHLSRGTCLARTVDGNAPYYVDGAIAPVPDWRELTPEENRVLWTDVAPPFSRGVGLVRLLSESLIHLFEAHSDVFSRAEDKATLEHPLVDALLDIVRKSDLTVEYVHSARIGRDVPGLVTMTKAVGQDARIGLHLDRWDRCPLDTLDNSTNRISINFGPTDRYFIFVNQTAAGMVAMLERAGIFVEHDVAIVGKAFLTTFPDYPVIRVRLRPGEAYVAPTENILHDGSSAEVGNVNHYLSLRGRFGFR